MDIGSSLEISRNHAVEKADFSQDEQDLQDEKKGFPELFGPPSVIILFSGDSSGSSCYSCLFYFFGRKLPQDYGLEQVLAAFHNLFSAGIGSDPRRAAECAPYLFKSTDFHP